MEAAAGSQVTLMILKSEHAAHLQAAHRFAFATLQGDVVAVQLTPDSPVHVPANFSEIAAAAAAAAAAGLGVPPEDIYIVDGRVTLYRPAITVRIVVLDPDGTSGTTRPIELDLATECGALDTADATARTTVAYAVRKIARSVFGLPSSDANAAIQLHVGDGAAGPDQRFRKLGGRDQGATRRGRERLTTRISESNVTRG